MYFPAMRGLKIAISGKGGVGKSTVVAVWARLLAQRGNPVYAIDADPDANLAHALGMPADIAANIVPLASNDRLVEERTGAKRGQTGQFFSLSPDVHDIAQKYAVEWHGVQTLVLGAVKKGGAGCACPESTLLKSLVRYLVLQDNEIVILDMAAGVEHLGRATAVGVDALVIVVEPGSRSIETAVTIERLAGEIGLAQRSFLLINKAREDRPTIDAVKTALPGVPLLGAIPYDERFIMADEKRQCVMDLTGQEADVAPFEHSLDTLVALIETQRNNRKEPL
jgi:CO dehydrogenase maturation factor